MDMASAKRVAPRRLKAQQIRKRGSRAWRFSGRRVMASLWHLPRLKTAAWRRGAQHQRGARQRGAAKRHQWRVKISGSEWRSGRA